MVNRDGFPSTHHLLFTIYQLSVADGLQARGAGRGDGERDAEGGAATGRALDGDVAGVLLHDAVGDGEAEAGAAPDALGREERVVEAGDVLGRDADAGVDDLDGDGAVGAAAALGGRAERDATARGDGVARVQQQVREDLLELARVAEDGRQFVRELARDLDLAVPELGLKEFESV